MLQRSLHVYCRGVQAICRSKPAGRRGRYARAGLVAMKTAQARSLALVVQNRRLYNQGGAFLARRKLELLNN
jgi:hypothetical protein